MHRLAERADIFLTNLTDDRRTRYGVVTAADIHAVNPTALYTLLTGYGTTGPLAGKPAYDWTAFFARGGVSSVIGEPGGPRLGFDPVRATTPPRLRCSRPRWRHCANATEPA